MRRTLKLKDCCTIIAGQSPESKYYNTDGITGTGIKHLTGQSLARVLVPTAERTTQDSIVAEIESRLSVCDNIERTVGIALQQAEALRQSILKIAFEGGL